MLYEHLLWGDSSNLAEADELISFWFFGFFLLCDKCWDLMCFLEDAEFWKARSFYFC